MIVFGTFTQSCVTKFKSESIADRKYVFKVPRPDGLSIDEVKRSACEQAKLKSFHIFFKKQFDFIMKVLDAKSTNELDNAEISQYKATNYTQCLSIPAKYYGRRLYQKAACESTNYSTNIDEKQEQNFYECIESKNNISNNALAITYPELDNIYVVFD